MAFGQQNQVIRGGENLQTAGLLAVGGVGSVVTARCGDAPTSPSGPRSKSLAAAPPRNFQTSSERLEILRPIRFNENEVVPNTTRGRIF